MNTRRTSSNNSNPAAKLKQTRTEQLEQICNIIPVIELRLKEIIPQNKQLKLLDSVSLGLYEEVDKLAKKAPAEEVTELVLTQMNELISETKELVSNDIYIQRLKEFVPAGNNPQHRDAVVVLRQVRQGLNRFKPELDDLDKQLKRKLSDARGIEIALKLYLDGEELIGEKDLKAYNTELSRFWMTKDYPCYFDFGNLDRTDIALYFGDTK